ncbi:hypothetical protein OAO01_08950 [Oligoflexia bacterium]|nr:hypothetical protein [Oligoflexia bacterium]
MMFSTLFNINVSVWEEQLIAFAYLSDQSIDEQMFEKQFVVRSDRIMSYLKELRPAWAKELCLSALLKEVKQEAYSGLSRSCL